MHYVKLQYAVASFIIRMIKSDINNIMKNSATHRKSFSHNFLEKITNCTQDKVYNSRNDIFATKELVFYITLIV